jgi:hypothetical protein
MLDDQDALGLERDKHLDLLQTSGESKSMVAVVDGALAMSGDPLAPVG